MGQSRVGPILSTEAGNLERNYPRAPEVWDAQRLFHGMQAGLDRDEIVVDFEQDFGGPVPCLPMPGLADDYEAYLVVLPGDLLDDLYEEYGARLLELNVRSFLSARGKVNNGIRRTLREEPARGLSDELTGLLRAWTHKVNDAILETADGPNVTEWCKKEACWTAVVQRQLDLPPELPPELLSRDQGAPGRATTRDNSMTAEDLENIAACKRLDGEQWLKIHAWGARSSETKDWEAGIAHIERLCGLRLAKEPIT